VVSSDSAESTRTSATAAVDAVATIGSAMKEVDATSTSKSCT
jgi:hypothetical protein